MLTKEELLASMRHETGIIKHLATKVTPDMLDWRPTAGQRSMLELMQYLTCMATITAENLTSRNWDHAEALGKEAAEVTLEGFPAAMDRQMSRIEEVFAGIDEGTARATPHTLPWGAPTTMSALTVDNVLKSLVAYRMQFFLYVKQAGCSELATPDCWVGVTRPA